MPDDGAPARAPGGRRRAPVPRRGPVQDFTAAGRTLVATRLYHDDAKRVGVIGLLRDDRVAAVLLRRDHEPDLAATVPDGTFSVAGPELVDLREHGRVTAAPITIDERGDVLETVPHQQA